MRPRHVYKPGLCCEWFLHESHLDLLVDLFDLPGGESSQPRRLEDGLPGGTRLLNGLLSGPCHAFISSGAPIASPLGSTLYCYGLH